MKAAIQTNYVAYHTYRLYILRVKNVSHVYYIISKKTMNFVPVQYFLRDRPNINVIVLLLGLILMLLCYC